MRQVDCGFGRKCCSTACKTMWLFAGILPACAFLFAAADAPAAVLPASSEVNPEKRRLAIYAGLEVQYDTNVYLDPSDKVADGKTVIYTGLECLLISPRREIDIGFQARYLAYWQENKLDTPEIEFAARGTFDMNRWELLIVERFRWLADPLTETIPAPFEDNMSRTINMFEPEVRVNLNKVHLAFSYLNRFQDYHASELDYLDFQDNAGKIEAGLTVLPKAEAYLHASFGSLDFREHNRDDYSYVRIYGGMKGQPSPKLVYNAALGWMGMDFSKGDRLDNLYVRAEATWDMQPSINRLMVSLVREGLPSTLITGDYMYVTRFDLKYIQWIGPKLHLDAGLLYENANRGADADSDTIGFQVGVRYELGTYRYFYLREELRSRNSELKGLDYSNSRTSLGFAYRF